MSRAIILVLFLASPIGLVIAQDTNGAVQSAFPDFLSSNARAASVIQSSTAIRKAVRPSTSTLPSTASILDVSVSHSFAMQWGDEIEVQAVVCDKETTDLVEKTISDLLTQEQFQTGPWDSQGFLKAKRDKYALLFRTPPPPLHESFHLLVKLDGQPKDLTEYIRLIYDVDAGPRPRHDPPPDRDWSNVTDTQVVKDYVDLNLSKGIHDAAVNTITSHCSKVKSGPAPTEKAALEKLDDHLSPAQGQSTRKMLERNKR